MHVAPVPLCSKVWPFHIPPLCRSTVSMVNYRMLCFQNAFEPKLLFSSHPVYFDAKIRSCSPPSPNLSNNFKLQFGKWGQSPSSLNFSHVKKGSNFGYPNTTVHGKIITLSWTSLPKECKLVWFKLHIRFYLEVFSYGDYFVLVAIDAHNML